MKRLLCLAVVITVSLLSWVNAHACEYDSGEKYILYSLLTPVITGVNAPSNSVKSWSFTDPDIYALYSFIDYESNLAVKYYIHRFAVERQEIGEVDFPLTVYIGFVGVQSESKGLNNWTKVNSTRFSETNTGLKINGIFLQYRVYPSLEWITVGVKSYVGYDTDAYNNALYKYLHDDIVAASLPDHNNFTVDSSKCHRMFGSYTIDGNISQGTKVQLRLVTKYQIWHELIPNSYYGSTTLVEEPSSYYGEDQNVLGGDFITVTASGKRRPRHDQ